MAREPMIMQDPNIPQISKVFFQRELLRLQWFSREFIYIQYRLSDDEIDALDYVRWINEIPDNADMDKELPKSMFYPWMDLFTYELYMHKAKPWKARDIILNKIKELKKKQWLDNMQVEQMTEDYKALWNSVSSQMTSNVISQQNKQQTPSRAQVLNS